MAKIFINESRTRRAKHLEQVQRKRLSAVELAAQGEFSFALAIFCEAVISETHMAEPWESHAKVLQEVRRAMEYNFQKAFAQQLSAHARALMDLFREPHVKEVAARLRSEIEQHIRAMRIAADLAAFIQLAAREIDRICENDFDQQGLIALSVRFNEAMGDPG